MTDDAECVCRGNWRAIVKESEPLLDQRFRDVRSGKEYVFFGVVHGSDDYYYGFHQGDELRLLSCVGSIESFGLVPVQQKTEQP